MLEYYGSVNRLELNVRLKVGDVQPVDIRHVSNAIRPFSSAALMSEGYSTVDLLDSAIVKNVSI